MEKGRKYSLIITLIWILLIPLFFVLHNYFSSNFRELSILSGIFFVFALLLIIGIPIPIIMLILFCFKKEKIKEDFTDFNENAQKSGRKQRKRR